MKYMLPWTDKRDSLKGAVSFQVVMSFSSKLKTENEMFNPSHVSRFIFIMSVFIHVENNNY